MKDNLSSQRRIILGSVTKQASNGRIVFAARMPLSGDSLGALPDWVSSGYTAVAQLYTEVQPEVQEVSGVSLTFLNDAPKSSLFKRPNATLPGASLKDFRIVRAGEPDDPEIELQFKIYGAFARDFWSWIGEMAGAEVYMAFPEIGGKIVKIDSGDNLPLEDEPGEQPGIPSDPSLEEAIGQEPMLAEVGMPAGKKAGRPKKSGPKELQAEHQRQVAMGKA